MDVFASLTAEQVVQRLDDAQIGNARMNDMHDLWAHPQLAARDRWRDVDTPAGPIKALLPPGAPEDFDVRMAPIPAVGEHTAKILAEIGYTDDAIAQLKATGAV